MQIVLGNRIRVLKNKNETKISQLFIKKKWLCSQDGMREWVKYSQCSVGASDRVARLAFSRPNMTNLAFF